MSYIGNTPVNQNFVAGADQFSGTGSQTVFTLSRNVNTVFDMFVTVSNVPQDPFTAYTVAGNTLTFDGAPPSGTNNIDVVYRATNVQTFVPTPGVSTQLGLGSASAPSLTFIGDTNTGIYSPGADTIAFTEGGVESMRLNSSGQIAVNAAGSASTPTITKADDLNTGIFYPAADTVAIGTGGTEALRVNSSQNVGIGTTSPNGTLTINKVNLSNGTVFLNGATTGADFMRLKSTGADGVLGIESSSGSNILSGSSANATVLYTVGATPLQFGTNSLVKATLDSAGNLGLGVTPSAWQANNRAIQLLEGWASLSSNNSQGCCDLANNGYNSGSSANNLWRYTNSSQPATLYQQNAGQHRWFYAGSGTAGNAITFTQAMTLDASGNLGIGTTSPNTKLELRTDTTTAGSEPNLLFQNRSTGTSSYAVGGIFGAAYRDVRDPAFIAGINFVRNSAVGGLASGGNIVFYTSTEGNTLAELKTLERARISAAGGFMVGMNNFTGSLSNGVGFGVDPVGYMQVVRNQDPPIVACRTVSTGAIINLAYGSTNTNGAVLGTISTNGSTISYNPSSDRRLKEDIQPMRDALTAVMKLKPVIYKWKNTGIADDGFIAQDLLETPEFTHRVNSIGKAEDESDIYGVDYMKFVSVLTAAIQEQQAMIDEMKAEIAALKAQP